MDEILKLRNDFPILKQTIYKRNIVYFDNAATTQKPYSVINVMKEYYEKYNSNIHRGVHFLSDKMTEAYENTRIIIKKFINAKHSHEVIFTSGTTESINLVAYCFAEKYIKENDEIILTIMEHHSNIVPWQLVAQRKNAKIKVIPIDYSGNLLINELNNLITEKTKIIALTHISNVIGTINDIKKVIEIAHSNNIPVLIDGAQSIQHTKIDVQELDCDFFVFSGHKIYGPTGTGVLYGKEKWLDDFPPYKGGGDMIKSVTFENTIFNSLPLKFEAGTTNFNGIVALGTAINYLNKNNFNNIINYEEKLTNYLLMKIMELDFVKIIGLPEKRSSIVSFTLNNIHHYDAGMLLDKMDIAVRTGHHCAQPLIKSFGIDGTIRVSLAFYNTFEEIDYLCECLKKVKEYFN
ncbi:MAG: cysteine desulfurase [Bacteroidales bacterium]|nr:cysteine desulfurase [Bacteroidales bacterium]